MKQTKRLLWGIVLAGGQGTRTRDFLAQLCGGRGIKQFCAVIGRRSMLQHTLARVEQLIPRKRVIVVVGTEHREEVNEQLRHWPPENVIFQPLNRDTAPGILLPLAHVSHRDPSATVAIFPSDHFILDEDRFMEAVDIATTETHRFVREMVLLGTTPTGVDDGYGWIEPGSEEQERHTRAVRRFWEKPEPHKAYGLLGQGAVWNTFVCIAQATTLWEMTQQAAPDLARDFTLIRRMLSTPHAGFITEQVYQTMRPVNFSSAMCETLPSRLRVLPVPEVGWSDWGSVERICKTLQQLGKYEECLARLQQRRGTASLVLPSITSPQLIAEGIPLSRTGRLSLL